MHRVWLQVLTDASTPLGALFERHAGAGATYMSFDEWKAFCAEEQSEEDEATVKRLFIEALHAGDPPPSPSPYAPRPAPGAPSAARRTTAIPGGATSRQGTLTTFRQRQNTRTLRAEFSKTVKGLLSGSTKNLLGGDEQGRTWHTPTPCTFPSVHC